MNRPVSAHIETIKHWIDQIELELSSATDELARHKAETDLRSLRLALVHYSLALEIEQEVIGARKLRPGVVELKYGPATAD